MTLAHPWLAFTNGTPGQQAMVEDALEASTYPFNDRLGITVTWTFQDEVDDDHDFALTTVHGTPTNNCARPTTADIIFKNGLEVDNPGDQYSGPKFAAETVVHEMGHIVAAWLTEAQITVICGLFGGMLSDWGPETDWVTRIQEAQAEFFKDVFLPADSRRYDNRTNWKMDRSNFDAWVEIMNTLCPCPGGVG